MHKNNYLKKKEKKKQIPNIKCAIISTDEDHDILQYADVRYIHEKVVLSHLFEEDRDVSRVSWLVDALSPVSHTGLYQG